MGAKLCVENKTNIPVAVLIEQLSVRYWARVPPQSKVIWLPDYYHVHRGIYTVRAVDASSQTFESPNMKKENAKAVGGGVLMGIGGATLLAGLALIVVPGLGVVLTGIGGAMAFAGGVGATGAGVAAALKKSQAVKRGVHIGRCKIVVNSEFDEGVMKLNLEKVDYDTDDEEDSRTTILIKDCDGITPTQDCQWSELLGKSFTCESGEFRSVCKRYFDSLRIPDTFLDRSYDKCFCEACAIARSDGTYIDIGDPPEGLAVPIGCMKFGVKLLPQATNEDIFNKWHGCYHGTSPENIIKILHVGRLLKPGDVDPEGTLRRPGPGRFTECTAPRGHDINQYFFTPSWKYTMYGNLYAAMKSFEDSVTRKKYFVHTILQVRVKPGSYSKGPQTMGAEEEIDGLFSNDEIEWFTNREGVHYIIGILVYMTMVD